MNKKKTRTSGGTGGLATRDRPGSSGGGSLSRDRGVGNKDQQRLVSSPSSLNEQSVYKNQRLTYFCTSLIGTTMSIETENGDIHEGVFRCFSPDLAITLDQVHTIDPEDTTRIKPETVQSTMIFEMDKIIRCMAIDVDLNAAKKEQDSGFRTDTQISASNKLNGEREWVRWEPDEADEQDVSLELDGGANESNGWKAEDMFKANADQYGLTSSYKSNLEGYTVQLNADKDSEKYRELEQKAAAMAREIEGSSTNKLAIELENGEEEEEAFSAVHRSGSNNRGERDGDGSKYVTPARRPPPGNSGSNNRSTPPQQMQRQQQSSPASMSRGSGGPVENANDRPRGRFQQGSSPANSTHSGRDQHFHDDYARAGGVGRGRGGGGGNNGPAYVNKEGPRQQGGPGGGGGGPGPGPGKSRNEQTSEFRKFQENFHLSSTTTDQSRYFDQKQPSPKLPSPPSVSAQAQQPNAAHSRPQMQPLHGDRSKQGPGTSPTTTTTATEVRRTSPPTASIIARQESIEQRTPTPVKTPPTTTPVAGIGVAPAMPTSQVAPAPPANPIAVKSKLNPNAKEFVLNPKAKEFQPSAPRPPVGQTPPPPRPITPATPTGGNIPIQAVGYYPTIQAAGGFNPYMGTVPNVSAASSYIYAPTTQPPPPHQYQQQPRFRGAAPPSSSAGGPGRENNQVLAATGQPLLSPQNNFALIPPTMAHMPPQVQQQAAQVAAHQHQQQMMPGAGSMVPVSGGPPVMVRPMEGATSLPAAWSLQPNQPPPQMGGPQHPPPSGTPTSANHPPLPAATPPNSGVVQPQHPTGAPSNHPQPNAAGGHGQPQLAPNGNQAVGNAGQPTAAGMYNFIPGSMQHQSLPHQFPYPQLLLQHGQTPLLQQPIMTQGQVPVTSMASGIQQFPYGAVPHSHQGVVPGQQSSPQFIIAPHMAPMHVAGSPAAAGGHAAAVVAAQAAAAQNQMQGHGPPGGPQ